MIILVLFTKLVGKILRFLRLGGGTSLPGLLIEKYFPSVLTTLAKGYKRIILITGTNGKTTTQRLLRHLLELKGQRVVSNLSGANLLRGIASSIVYDCNLSGKVRSEIAIFEVEEATMPHVTRLIKPDFIIVTNLFRDQLDAYGEILKTRSYIVTAIKQAEEAEVALNKDDANVSSIASEIENQTCFFSLEDARVKDIFYERSYFKSKGTENIRTISATHIQIEKDLSSRFDVKGLNNDLKNLKFKSPGLPNVYNALAALSVAYEICTYSSNEIQTAFVRFNPAFGRGETIEINKKKIRLLLIKNPASFTANLSMLKNFLNLKLMIVINDKIADGRDVSWLWDADIEILQKVNIDWITVSGIRAKDMLLRLKYAQVSSMSTELVESISKALDISLAKLKSNETLFILPTYTAMLEVRKAIGRIVKVEAFWKR